MTFGSLREEQIKSKNDSWSQEELVSGLQAQEGAGWGPTKEKQRETATRMFPLLP